jgi:hypothetical protein
MMFHYKRHSVLNDIRWFDKDLEGGIIVYATVLSQNLPWVKKGNLLTAGKPWPQAQSISMALTVQQSPAICSVRLQKISTQTGLQHQQNN